MTIASLVKRIISRCSRVEVNLTQVGKNKLLAGKNVVVMGGTSGIGLAIADAACKAGARVLVIGRNEEKLKNVLADRAADSFFGLTADVSRCETDEMLPALAREKLGAEADIVINAAGVLSPQCLKQDFLSVDEKTWNYVMDTNIKGMFFVCQAFIRDWLALDERKRRHILNICSTEGLHGIVVPYGVSKWGTIGLTKGLGKKYAMSGIVVNGIAPGGTATQMLGFEKGSNLQWSVPNNRVSLPEEIGELAVFMCSDMGDNMVGSVVTCDGGESLR